MARFTFSDAATTTATFNDVVTDSETTATWYRLWTGNAAGDEGNWVDTGSFNDYGDGWIDKNDLDKLDIDYLQEGDTELWIQPWNSSEGSGDWAHGAVDFSTATDADITTNINADTAMDQMFTNDDATTDTWYNLWIGNAAGDTGSFVDTGHHQGWVQAANLGDYDFTTEDAGNDLWVETWTPEDGSLGWDHWSVTTSAISGNTYTLTAAPDTLTGTANNDQFNALEDGDLSIDDTLDGAGGTDVLYARDIQTNVGAFTSTNIEELNIRNGGTAVITPTMDLANASGYTSVIASAPGSAAGSTLTIDNIDYTEGATLSVLNNNNSNNVVFQYTDGDLSGSTDTVDLTLSGNNSSFSLDINDPAAADQLEKLNISSSANNAGTITLLNDAVSATTIDIGGSGSLDISGAAFDGTTLDAEDSSGGVTALLGAANQTVTGGSGNDVFLFNGNLDSNDTVDGKGGTNTIGIGVAPGTTGFSNVSNFDAVAIQGNNLTVDNDNIGVNNYQILPTDNISGSFNLGDASNNTTITIAQDDTQNMTTLSVTLKTDTVDDNLIVDLQSDDGGGAGGTMTLTNLDGGSKIDDVTINSSGEGSLNGNEITSYDVAAPNLQITGDLDLTIVGLGANASGDLQVVDASGMSAGLTADFSAGTNDLTITGASSNANDIRGGTSDDTINGGSKADLLAGDDGADVITGGGGNDIFAYSDAAHVAHGSKTDTIDFNATGSDAFLFDVGTNVGSLFSGAATGTTGAINKLYVLEYSATNKATVISQTAGGATNTTGNAQALTNAKQFLVASNSNALLTKINNFSAGTNLDAANNATFVAFAVLTGGTTDQMVALKLTASNGTANDKLTAAATAGDIITLANMPDSSGIAFGDITIV